MLVSYFFQLMILIFFHSSVWQGTGTVTVAVQDTNDNSPTCTQSSWSQTVLESVCESTSALPLLDTSDTEMKFSLSVEHLELAKVPSLMPVAGHFPVC